MVGDNVWATGDIREEGASLYRITGGEVVAKTRIGMVPTALIFAHGLVWVANGSGAGAVYNSMTREPEFPGENSVQSIEPRSVEVRTSVRVPNPLGLASTPGAVWVLTSGADVYRMSPRTGRVSGQIELTGTGLALAATDDVVWALTITRDGGRLFRLDPTADEVAAEIPVPAQPTSDLAATTEGVWILLTGPDGGVVHVDASTNAQDGLDQDLPFPRSLVAAGEWLWVGVDGEPPMLRLVDAVGGKEVTSRPIPGLVRFEAAENDTAWAGTSHGLIRFHVSAE